jgi:hypothetical protein
LGGAGGCKDFALDEAKIHFLPKLIEEGIVDFVNLLLPND